MSVSYLDLIHDIVLLMLGHLAYLISSYSELRRRVDDLPRSVEDEEPHAGT
jgi:hypothetical protein